MTLIDRIERLKRIDYLIRHKATVTPAQLAEKLEISESTLYEYLNDMEMLGAEITYNRQSMSYEYCKPTKLVLEIQPLDLKKVNGGKLIFPLRKNRSGLLYYYSAKTFITAGEMVYLPNLLHCP